MAPGIVAKLQCLGVGLMVAVLLVLSSLLQSARLVLSSLRHLSFMFAAPVAGAPWTLALVVVLLGFTGNLAVLPLNFGDFFGGQGAYFGLES